MFRWLFRSWNPGKSFSKQGFTRTSSVADGDRGASRNKLVLGQTTTTSVADGDRGASRNLLDLDKAAGLSVADGDRGASRN